MLNLCKYCTEYVFKEIPRLALCRPIMDERDARDANIYRRRGQGKKSEWLSDRSSVSSRFAMCDWSLRSSIVVSTGEPSDVAFVLMAGQPSLCRQTATNARHQYVVDGLAIPAVR